MTQDNLSFYAFNNPYTALPLKQTIGDSRNQEHKPNMSMLNLQIQSDKKIHHTWKPAISSKKLFDQPKFFLSLERKKVRIINAIKNMSQFCTRQHISSPPRAKKAKQKGLNLRRMSNTLEPIQKVLPKSGRLGWQPSNKTPYLNFNMQYLIKKRKSLTPSLYKGLEFKSHSACLK